MLCTLNSFCHDAYVSALLLLGSWGCFSAPGAGRLILSAKSSPRGWAECMSTCLLFLHVLSGPHQCRKTIRDQKSTLAKLRGFATPTYVMKEQQCSLQGCFELRLANI